MSTFETHAPAAPSKLWSLAHTAYTNVVTQLKMLADAIAEAQRMAREYERRYPMGQDW